MPYGILKVDTITFTNGGVDQSITVSGIVGSISGNLTATGTISGNTIRGGTTVSGATVTGAAGQFGNLTSVSGVFTTQISGATVTGNVGRFTTVTGISGVFTTQLSGAVITGSTAGFTTVTGTTVTGTTSNFQSGVFTTQISGATVTGNVGRFTSVTGGTAGFTTVTGSTVTGTTANFTSGNFTSISGTTHTITSGVFASGTAANPSISFISDPNTGIYSPGPDQLAITTSGTDRIKIDSVGLVTISGSLKDPAITGTIIEDVFTITDGAAFEIDPSNGSVQLITLGASRTPKATNFIAGEAITLMVDDGTAYTLTWTDATRGGSGVVWKTDSGTAPTLNTSGYTVITLWKVGTQVYGARVGNA